MTLIPAQGGGPQFLAVRNSYLASLVVEAPERIATWWQEAGDTSAPSAARKRRVLFSLSS